MPAHKSRLLRCVTSLALLTLLTLSSTGCVGLLSNLGHALIGNNRPAEYKDLAKARVVVMVANEQGIGNDFASGALARYVQELLSRNLKKAEIVPQQDIDQYLSKHGWTDVDYVEVGRDLRANRVLVVTMENLTLQDGATLYRGSSDIDVAVYDIDDGGKVAYRRQFPEFSFPSMGGTPTTDTSEARFRTLYLNHVANRVSSLFYEIEATSDFALDATANRL